MQPSLINDLDRLQHGVADAWKSIGVATVNGNAVRCRITQDATANWRVHDDSDKPFYVISGAASLDTEHSTHPLAAGQLLVVPGNAPVSKAAPPCLSSTTSVDRVRRAQCSIRRGRSSARNCASRRGAS